VLAAMLGLLAHDRARVAGWNYWNRSRSCVALSDFSFLVSAIFRSSVSS
jgi:hypothetical protein